MHCWIQPLAWHVASAISVPWLWTKQGDMMTSKRFVTSFVSLVSPIWMTSFYISLSPCLFTSLSSLVGHLPIGRWHPHRFRVWTAFAPTLLTSWLLVFTLHSLSSSSAIFRWFLGQHCQVEIDPSILSHNASILVWQTAGVAQATSFKIYLWMLFSCVTWVSMSVEFKFGCWRKSTIVPCFLWQVFISCANWHGRWSTVETRLYISFCLFTICNGVIKHEYIQAFLCVWTWKLIWVCIGFFPRIGFPPLL